MKKLFLIFFLFFSFENISYSQDLNEILKRLDKIDKRLSDIEDKMKFFDILSGLETSGLDKTNENIDNSLFPKIKAEIGLINCKKAEYFGNELYIAGTYQNNYDKGIKMIDGAIVIKDLFGDTISRLSISKNTKIRTDKYSSFSGSYNIGSSEDCKNMNNENLKDYKFNLDIRKIAFEDNSILEF